MGPLGRLDLGQVTVDGTPVRATLHDQTITVPFGGVLAPGGDRRRPGAVPRDPALDHRRLDVAVHARQRRHQPLPLGAVGQPRDPVRPPQLRRPVRDARQPAGDPPAPDRRPGHGRREREPDLALRRRPRDHVGRDQRPRPRRQRRRRLPDAHAPGRRHEAGRAHPPRRAGRRDRGRRGDRPRRSSRRGSALPVARAADRPVVGRRRHGRSGHRVDPAEPVRREPALPADARGRAPVVLRARRQRPGPRAVRRRGAGRRRRALPHRHPPRVALRLGRRSTSRSTATAAAATTSRSTSRAATCSTTPAGASARRRSSPRCAATSPTTAGSSSTRGPCSTPSMPQPRCTSPVAGAPGSRRCTDTRDGDERPPRDARRRRRLRRDLRPVRGRHRDLVRGRPADGATRWPRGSPARSSARRGSWSRSTASCARTRTGPPPRPRGVRLDGRDDGLRRSRLRAARARAAGDGRGRRDPAAPGRAPRGRRDHAAQPGFGPAPRVAGVPPDRRVRGHRLEAGRLARGGLVRAGAGAA